MEINVFTLLNEDPILLILTVIGLGYLVGNIRIAGIDLPAEAAGHEGERKTLFLRERALW